jgi:hypothetical protein
VGTAEYERSSAVRRPPFCLYNPENGRPFSTVLHGLFFVLLKSRLSEHMLWRGHAAPFVDEAVRVSNDEVGAGTLSGLVRRGRHFGLQVHVLIQCVTDRSDTRIERTIQSVRRPNALASATRASCMKLRRRRASRQQIAPRKARGLLSAASSAEARNAGSAVG